MTTELAALSLARADLPVFQGNTLPEKLAAGRAAAEKALRKYRPELSFDLAAADATLSKVEVWEERNHDALAKTLADPTATSLPEAVRIAFDAPTAQAFVIASFTRAAWGIGPWMSGAVGREALAPGVKTINPAWAQEDAGYRLQVFGAVVKMDETGYLKALFTPPAPGSTQGYGALGIAPVVVWAVVVAVVAIAALFLLYLYSSKRLADNNVLMRDLCEKAQKEGDHATVEKCIEATHDLQAEGMIPGVKELASGLVKVAAIVGLVWVGFKVIPPLLKKGKGA